MKITYQQVQKGGYILWSVVGEDGKTVIIGDFIASGSEPTKRKAKVAAQKAYNHALTLSRN